MLPRYLRQVGWCSFWVVLFTLTLSPSNVFAASLKGQEKLPVTMSPQVAVADIALQRLGVLQGQVVNAAGVGVTGVTVKLTNGRQNWQAKTDAQGQFQITGLRGGTYQFRTAEQVHMMRIWAAGTAPPRASQGVLITPSADVFRGQRVVSPNTNQFFRVAKQRLANPVVYGGIVATAVAIPVAIHNSDDDPPATP